MHRARKLGVAVVGQGWWGRAVVRVLEGSDRTRIVTTVDVDPAAAELAGARGVDFTTDYDAALHDDVDAGRSASLRTRA